MLKIGKNNAKYFLTKTIAVSFLAFFALAGSAQAANISVSFGAGFPISETNMAPGQIFEREFTVTNNLAGDQSLMMRIDDQVGSWHLGSFDVEEKLNFQIKKPDTTLATLPNGLTSETLKDLYAFDAPFIFDTLMGPIGNAKTYKILVTFDASADNNYQNKKTIFDMAVGIDAIDAVPLTVTRRNNNGGGGGGGGNGGGGGGAAALAGPAAPGLFGLAGTTGTATGTVGGVETALGEVVAGEAAPIVEGAETETVCSEWPLWVWILLLVIYTAVFNYASYRQSLENKIHWFFPAFWTAVIFAVWYFFDKCRYYTWYPYAIVIIALLSYFSYLSWFRKKKLEPNFKDEEEM